MIDYLPRTVNRLHVYVEIICIQGRSQTFDREGAKRGQYKYVLKFIIKLLVYTGTFLNH